VDVETVRLRLDGRHWSRTACHVTGTCAIVCVAVSGSADSDVDFLSRRPLITSEAAALLEAATKLALR
jgi:hypothetical protein